MGLFPLVILAAQGAPATEEMALPDFQVSVQLYQNCVEYRSIRLDDGQMDIDVLINTAREECRVERAILEVIVSELAGRDPELTEPEARVVASTVMERINSENAEHIGEVITDVRLIQRVTND